MLDALLEEESMKAKNAGLILVAGALALSACAGPSSPAPESPEAPGGQVGGKICVVLDSGGVDDRGYNQSAWEGAQQAAASLNWDAVYLESMQQTDWDKNIGEFLRSDCSLITVVGYLGADALQAAVEANPDQPFQILDYAYDPPFANVWAQLYAMEEGAFLAGYAAAGMTTSGKIGVFGGMNIPPVADFFIGFEGGIDLYNERHGTSVELYGWSNDELDGTFLGSFTDTEGARRYTENLMDEGVDIVLPQSGVEALAAAATMLERGGVMAIGADADQFLADTASGSVYLTTIMKNLGLSIVEAATAVANGVFVGGTQMATLATGGLALAPFHDFDSTVPEGLKAELEQVRQDIIDGTIVVDNWASLSAR
jgi:basic membrane protein A